MRVRKIRSLSAWGDRPITEVRRIMFFSPTNVRRPLDQKLVLGSIIISYLAHCTEITIGVVPTKFSRISRWVLVFGIISLCSVISQAATIVVPPGADLQAAINAAQPGDTIVLQAGGVYQTPFNYTAYTLPDKGAGSAYITITSSTAPPADGTRVTFADRAKMPKLVASVGAPGFFNVANKASRYRLSGLWFTNVKDSSGTGTTFLIGGGNTITGAQVPHGGDITQFPHDVIIDHCFFNPVDWDENNQQNLYS